MKQYSRLNIVLHWLLMPAILIALFMGQDIAQLSNDLDLKVDRLVVHMIAGSIIGVLFLVRFIAIKLSNPVQNLEGSKWVNRLAKLTHKAMYLSVFAIVVTGIGMAIQVDMPNIVKTGDTMPYSLSGLPVRQAHTFFTSFLFMLILLHVSAALFHQFIKSDKIFYRMGIGKDT